MKSQQIIRRDGASELTAEIIEALESHGVANDEYTLHEFVDVEALDELRTSASKDVEVRFTIKGVHLAVTQDGVDVRAD